MNKFDDVDAALVELEAMADDVASDLGLERGEDCPDDCYSDLVANVATMCTPEVKRELLRRTGCMDRTSDYDPLEEL